MDEMTKKDEILKMMNKVFESQREEIMKDIQEQSPFGKIMFGVDFGSTDSSSVLVMVDEKGFRVMPKPGSIDYIDPDGIVIMHDNEIVEDKLKMKVTLSRRWVSRR